MNLKDGEFWKRVEREWSLREEEEGEGRDLDIHQGCQNSELREGCQGGGARAGPRGRRGQRKAGIWGSYIMYCGDRGSNPPIAPYKLWIGESSITIVIIHHHRSTEFKLLMVQVADS